MTSSLTLDEALDYLSKARITLEGNEALILCLKDSGLEDVHVESLRVVKDDNSRYIEVLASHPGLTDLGPESKVVTVHKLVGLPDVFQDARALLYKDGSGILAIKQGVSRIEIYPTGQWTKCVIS